MDLVRRQYSGNAGGVIKGIGVVTCVYINPELDQFWVIDYRIYAPDNDGKTKLNHVREMLLAAGGDKELPIYAILMDSWYAERKLMMCIERLGLFYYCQLKANRLVDESDGQESYVRIDQLPRENTHTHQLEEVHIKSSPKSHRVRLLRLVLANERTEYVVTNDCSQDNAHDTQKVCALRWKIEQLHREAKQLTGLENCQCRRARIQRNHIACAFLVWARLKAVAQETGQTLYSG